MSPEEVKQLINEGPHPTLRRETCPLKREATVVYEEHIPTDSHDSQKSLSATFPWNALWLPASQVPKTAGEGLPDIRGSSSPHFLLLG